jgi:hypothetical protein
MSDHDDSTPLLGQDATMSASTAWTATGLFLASAFLSPPASFIADVLADTNAFLTGVSVVYNVAT